MIHQHFRKFAAAASIATALTAAPAMAQQISIAATGQTSSYYGYHAAVAQVIQSEFPDISVTVMETGGSVENLRLLQRGQADWGQFVEPTFYQDYAGVGAAEGNDPQSDLRFLWSIATIALYNVVDAKADVASMGDLTGKAYGAGSSGSLTEKITADLMSIAGSEAEMMRGGYGDLTAAMKDGRLLGFTKSGSLTSQDATVMDVQASLPLKVIGFTDAERDAILEKYPYYSLVTMDETPYGDGPVTLYQTALIAGATAALDDDVAYKAFKAVAENMETIAATFKPVAGVNLIEATLASAKTPLHPGVIRYMEEKGYTVPADLIPAN